MEIITYVLKWSEAILRWGHVLFAILWVGNSFLFNYLDNKLNKNIDSKYIDGEGYLMHSGFFYKLSRLKTSPNKSYLNQLVIFKWQSYLTFITGILLLAVIYYYNSGVLMVDKRVLVLSPLAAISYSVLSLILSWVIYDFLCKSRLIKNNFLFFEHNVNFISYFIIWFDKNIWSKICIFECWSNYRNKYVCKCFYGNNSKSNEYNK